MVRRSSRRLVVATRIQGGIGALAVLSVGRLAVFAMGGRRAVRPSSCQAGCCHCCNNDGGSERGCQKPPGLGWPWAPPSLVLCCRLNQPAPASAMSVRPRAARWLTSSERWVETLAAMTATWAAAATAKAGTA